MGEAKRKKIATDRPTEPKRPQEPEVRGKHRFRKTDYGFVCAACGTKVMQTPTGWVKKLGNGICG
jgi:formate hydrogenlyase subunit 6/NADH:ubiquinone oxidoreductase subunit I